MIFLLADVGGTNARLALARDGVIDRATISRFRGDDHASFDEVVSLFLEQQGNPGIDAVCVDVAGPVSGGQAQLTNRDWDFTEARLRDLTGAPRARLINDLIALGYATPALDGEAAGFLRRLPETARGNGQRLVVNAGTGFNVCAVKVLPDGGIACLEAEEGHTRLPHSVWLPLTEALGDITGFIPSRNFLPVAVWRGCMRVMPAWPRSAPRRSSPPPPAATRRPRRPVRFTPIFSG